MQSLFFNAGDRRYRQEHRQFGSGTIDRIDHSNGMVVFHIKSGATPFRREIQGIDRMAVLILIERGGYRIEQGRKSFVGQAAQSRLYISASQHFKLRIEPQSDIYLFAVADFFLKRYLSGLQDDPIDFLYRLCQSHEAIRQVDLQPSDALSLHLAKKIATPGHFGRMAALRAERDLMELLIHRFEMIDTMGKRVDEASTKIVRQATAYLDANFIDPPTIGELAKLCATNTTTLKTLFKKVHGRTIGAYVRRLRLLKANQLLKDGDLSIQEVAHAVGFRHHGHFSRLFYEAFGIYPKDLK